MYYYNIFILYNFQNIFNSVDLKYRKYLKLVVQPQNQTGMLNNYESQYDIHMCAA